MQRGFIITGTDTGIGKTVVSAMLVQAFGCCYHKPVQAGLDEETDSDAVQRLAECSAERVIAERYRLVTPASPHLAAEIDGVEITVDSLELPASDLPLIVEGAGGLMVPLNRETLYIDMFQKWCLPLILCARTTLGTINHTLLSIQAMRKRRLNIHGVVFVGDANESSESIIEAFGHVRRLGRLPHLHPLTTDALATAFKNNFERSDFSDQLSGNHS